MHETWKLNWTGSVLSCLLVFVKSWPSHFWIWDRIARFSSNTRFPQTTKGWLVNQNSVSCGVPEVSSLVRVGFPQHKWCRQPWKQPLIMTCRHTCIWTVKRNWNTQTPEPKNNSWVRWLWVYLNRNGSLLTFHLHQTFSTHTKTATKMLKEIKVMWNLINSF